MLHDKLTCTADIEYIMKLKSRNATGTHTRRLRVGSREITTKDQIMKQKKTLKNLDGEQIWITDDFTLYRNRLAYLACKTEKYEEGVLDMNIQKQEKKR